MQDDLKRFILLLYLGALHFTENCGTFILHAGRRGGCGILRNPKHSLNDGIGRLHQAVNFKTELLIFASRNIRAQNMFEKFFDDFSMASKILRS